MRNLILSLLALLCAAAAWGKPAEPDFAYPQTVLAEARQKLTRSGGQGSDAALAMLEITVATMSIDGDSVFLLPRQIHTLAENQKSPAVRSLLLIMEARTLQAIYGNKRWQYDRTDTPDEPLPDDVALWNGRQFRSQINALASAAYDAACADPKPLDDFDDIVSADRIALMYYPTVRDFAALKAIDLIRYDDPAEQTLAQNSIIEKEIALSRPGSYCHINWLCRQLDKLPDSDIRSERLLELYHKYSDNEAACQPLEMYLEQFGCRNATASAVAMARDAIARFPEYWNVNALRNTVAELLRPWLSYHAPATCIPGKEMEITVNYGNITGKGGIVVYRGTGNGSSAAALKTAKMTEVARFRISPEANAPYQAKTTFKYTPDSEVYYYIRSFLGDSLCSKQDAKAILCTSLTPIVINGCTEQAVLVADAASGQPVKGVSVRVGRQGRTVVAPVAMGKTDDEGALRYRLPASLSHNSGGRRYLQLVNNGRSYDFGGMLNVAPYGRYYNNRIQYNALVMSNRALYHLGDTIRWAATVSSYDPATDRSQLCPGLEVRMTLRDANYQTVADTTLRTDDFGRIAGFSVTNTDGLSGAFSIEAMYAGNHIGATSVEVSDFKLPQFSVRVDSTLRDQPRRGWVTIRGNATTYSMMPVAEARVQAEIKAANRFRWFTPDRTIGYVQTTTDAAGDFSIEVSDSLLGLTDLDCYIAEIQVVAASGESRNASAQFTTGKPLEIVINSKPLDCADKVALPAAVYNADGVRRDAPLTWQLLAHNTEIAAGTAAAPDYKVDWQSVPSGEYTLKVCTADTALADCTSGEISLYNTHLGTMSSARPLFVPEKSLNFRHGHSGELLYGVPSDTYLYMTLGVDSLLVSVEGLDTSAGFHHLKLTLPEGYEQGRLTLYAVKDGKIYAEQINVSEKVDRQIAIEGESFRDRIAPGDVEHWRLKLTSPESGKHLESAVVATAYNKALSALAPLRWPSEFHRRYGWTSINNDSYATSSWLSGRYFMAARLGKRLPEAAFNLPDLRYPIAIGGQRIRIRGSRKLANGVEEVYVEEKMYMSPATADMAAPKMEAAGAIEEEAVDDIAEDSNEADAGSAEAPATNSDNFAYHPSEVLQALWMPSLVSDRDGNVDIEFTVPQANTTWTFQAFAWDKRLNSGSFVRDVVSQKPVMVQPNLPRFLRAGDSATVLATVYNNSPEADSIHTVAEIFDPATGRVLSSSAVSVKVAPEGSAIVALPVEAPADASMIGYRVRSSLAKFTDGEQALIPVLPASTEVMESKIFSLTANTAEVSVELPKSDKMELALEFCSNPAWDVIKALPSLFEVKASTATTAARQLFRAAGSTGLLHSDPQIAPTLRRALDNPQDSSLVSQLEKNDELKLATLQQTPWVQAAASQTERMARLELLFNAKAVNADINDALRLLSKLQNPDGGWRWGDWSDESSEWATRTVLLSLGRLNALGYLPSDKRLSPMINAALGYCESKLGNTKTDPQLAWIYTLLPDRKPGMKAKKVIDATVQQLIGGWRSLNVGGKAQAALMLQHYGYKNVAGELLSSMAQFAKTDKDGSIYFPSVDDIDQYSAVLFAWAALEPDAQLIDGVRQWLVMRSQRTDALASCDPTELIAAFLRSGSRWTVPAELPRVSLGSLPLTIPKAESMTGHFTMMVDNSLRARSLTISRDNPATPAWGALMSRYSGRTDHIKAAACSGLSIEKQLTVLRDGRWQYADEVRLGERVRVVLTLKVKDDLQYVTIVDDRAAGLEPVDQLPGYTASAGVRFYRENANTATRFFIGWLPRGSYSLSYELTANMAGSFISGVASAQSQYAPAITAHSDGYRLTVK